jgi:hypothetical protein
LTISRFERAATPVQKVWRRARAAAILGDVAEAGLQRDHALLPALTTDLQAPCARWAGDAGQPERDGLGKPDPRYADSATSATSRSGQRLDRLALGSSVPAAAEGVSATFSWRIALGALTASLGFGTAFIGLRSRISSSMRYAKKRF